MTILIHAGDQAAAGFAGKSGFDTGDVRIQKELIGGGQMDQVLAVEADDVPFERANHHGEGGGAHGFFREFGQVYGGRVMLGGVEAAGIGKMGPV